MVPAHHGLRRRAARGHGRARRRLARARADRCSATGSANRAARACASASLGGRDDSHRGLHHARGHDLRRLGASFFRPGHPLLPGLFAGQEQSRCARSRNGTSCAARSFARRGTGDGGKGRFLHRPLRDKSVLRREGAHLGGEFRARGIRHRRGDVPFRRTISAISSSPEIRDSVESRHSGRGRGNDDRCRSAREA